MDYFWLHVLLSFLVGSFWITLISISADRYGSRLGGFISGLPSTIAISFFFIGWSQSPQAAVDATVLFPAAFGGTCLFLAFYAWFSKRGFAAGMLGALALWACFSLILGFAVPRNFFLSIALSFLLFAFTFLIIKKKADVTSFSGKKMRYSIGEIIFRAVSGGLVIAVAVLMSKLSSPFIGGIFSAFPAMFSTTLYLTYRSRGLAFSQAMTKPMVVTGISTLLLYAVGVRYTYTTLGLVLGTIVSFALAALGAYAAYKILHKDIEKVL